MEQIRPLISEYIAQDRVFSKFKKRITYLKKVPLNWLATKFLTMSLQMKLTSTLEIKVIIIDRGVKQAEGKKRKLSLRMKRTKKMQS